MGLWLPEKYRKPATSVYVQGVEVALNYRGPVPEGLDTIKLPAANGAKRARVYSLSLWAKGAT